MKFFFHEHEQYKQLIKALSTIDTRNSETG